MILLEVSPGRGACMHEYLALKNQSPLPPEDCRRALGVVLLQGPRGALFLMGEVPLKWLRERDGDRDQQ